MENLREIIFCLLFKLFLSHKKKYFKHVSVGPNKNSNELHKLFSNTNSMIINTKSDLLALYRTQKKKNSVHVIYKN